MEIKQRCSRLVDLGLALTMSASVISASYLVIGWNNLYESIRNYGSVESLQDERPASAAVGGHSNPVEWPETRESF